MLWIKFAVVCFLALNSPTFAQGIADYKDPQELNAALLAFNGPAEDGLKITVRPIGRSGQSRDILMVKIGSVPRTTELKPGFLIECGMHGSEWAVTEVCFNFISDLKERHEALSVAGGSGLLDIFNAVDLFVIVSSNPDGRANADQNGGNPFFSSALGRKNRQPVVCQDGTDGIGIDLARNFSVDFDGDSANRDCTHSRFRGTQPFEAIEARILRRFVNNRLIGMSLTVHGNDQTFGRPFSDGKPFGVSQFIEIFNNGAPVEFALSPARIGGRSGQLPAWLGRESDFGTSSDLGTIRGINPFFLEIPPKSDWYDIPGHDYRVERFHPVSNIPFAQSALRPTSDAFFEDIRSPILDSFLFLARQAAYPWLEINPTDGMPLQCATGDICDDDFGLVGSTITSATLTSIDRLRHGGDLRADFVPEPHEYLLPSSDYAAWVGVQNSSKNSGIVQRDVSFLLEQQQPNGTFLEIWGSRTPFRVQTVSLDAGEITFLRSPLIDVQDGGEYRLTIQIQGNDNYSRNDQHIFRFRVHG